jgi:hypothetical protein
MTAGLKALGILGGGVVLASIVASDPTSTQTAQPAPTPIVQQRNITPPPVTNTRDESPAPPRVTPTPVAPKPVQTTSNCHPGYSGCLKQNAGDYDCAGGSGNGPNYTGPVRVLGSDPFGLDRDNDGWGCE